MSHLHIPFTLNKIITIMIIMSKFLVHLTGLLLVLLEFFFFFKILSIFNTHSRRGEKVLKKKLTMVYIQKGLTLRYTVKTFSTIGN